MAPWFAAWKNPPGSAEKLAQALQLPDQEFDLPYDVGPDLDFDVHPQILLPGTLLT